jgi:hypothetical protein
MATQTRAQASKPTTCSVLVDLLLFLFHEHARLESQSRRVTLDFCQRQTRD